MVRVCWRRDSHRDGLMIRAGTMILGHAWEQSRGGTWIRGRAIVMDFDIMDSARRSSDVRRELL